MKPSYVLNKQHETNVQIQQQCKGFNHSFEMKIQQSFFGIGCVLELKKPLVKIKLLNILKYYHILVKSGLKATY